MKKIFTLLLSFTLLVGVTCAQSILDNLNFETWSTASIPQLDYWTDAGIQTIANSNSINDTTITQCAGYHSAYGACVKPILPLDKLGYPAAYAGFTFGALASGNNSSTQVPFTHQLDSVEFAYKMTAPGTPLIFNASLVVALLNGTDTVAQVKNTFNTLQSTYNLFNAAFVYSSGQENTIPDSLTFSLALLADTATSNTKKAAFIIDGIRFTNRTTTGIKNLYNSLITVYPTITSGKINFDLPSYSGGIEIEIHDMMGKLISTSHSNDAHVTDDIGNQPDGIYTYNIKGLTFNKTGKIILQK